MAVVRSTRNVMLITSAALLPGLGVMTWTYGPGILGNLAWLTVFALIIELACLKLRGEPVLRASGDFSWLVTAWLIGACLPPSVDVSVLLWAALAAVGLAKHAYGGAGHNVFNPAMAGYAVILVAFADRVDHWPLPSTGEAISVDALTGATQLSFFRFREGLTVEEFELMFSPVLNQQEWVALGFAAGGLVLLGLRIIAWQVIAGVVLGVAVTALALFDGGSSNSAGALSFHLASGGFAAAAFFVVTDPVTHPRSAAHQWLFGLLCGLLIVIIRAYGIYPDGIAFAVLLANCCTPFLNRLADRGTAAAAGGAP